MKVSIIIPIYNVEDYLRECLESVLSQTLKEFEIIVINDGSTDNSLSILMEYQNQFEHFILVNQTNKGLSAARNIGLRLAKGEFVYFLDSDDYITSNAMQLCYQEAKINDLDILIFDAKNFSNENLGVVPFFRPCLPTTVLQGGDFFIDFYSSIDYNAAVCYQFFRRSFLLNNDLKFYERIIHEDELFTFESLLMADRVKYVSMPLYYRRIRSGSITTGGVSEEKVLSLILIAREADTFVRNNELKNNDLLKQSVKKAIENFYYFAYYFCDQDNYQALREELRQEIHSRLSTNIELNMQVDASCLFYHRTLYF